MKRFTFLILVFTLALSSAGFKCGIKELDSSRPKEPTGEERVYASMPIEMPPLMSLHRSVTPKGANIYSQDPIPAEFQATQFKAVDQAIDRGILATAGKGWTLLRSHSGIGVVMLRPTYENKEGNVGAGALKMRDGTPIAGIVLTFPTANNTETSYIVVAQNWKFPQETRLATKNEYEHLARKFNNYQEFVATSGDADRHPLDPLPDDTEWQSAPIN